jgi:hypothetical protein
MQICQRIRVLNQKYQTREILALIQYNYDQFEIRWNQIQFLQMSNLNVEKASRVIEEACMVSGDTDL